MSNISWSSRCHSFLQQSGLTLFQSCLATPNTTRSAGYAALNLSESNSSTTSSEAPPAVEKEKCCTLSYALWFVIALDFGLFVALIGVMIGIKCRRRAKPATGRGSTTVASERCVTTSPRVPGLTRKRTGHGGAEKTRKPEARKTAKRPRSHFFPARCPKKPRMVATDVEPRPLFNPLGTRSTPRRSLLSWRVGEGFPPTLEHFTPSIHQCSGVTSTGWQPQAPSLAPRETSMTETAVVSPCVPLPPPQLLTDLLPVSTGLLAKEAAKN